MLWIYNPAANNIFYDNRPHQCSSSSKLSKTYLKWTYGDKESDKKGTNCLLIFSIQFFYFFIFGLIILRSVIIRMRYEVLYYVTFLLYMFV